MSGHLDAWARRSLMLALFPDVGDRDGEVSSFLTLPADVVGDKTSVSMERAGSSTSALTFTSLSPALSLVEEGKHLGDIELNVFQVKILQVVLLHLEKVVEFEV